VRIHQLSVNYLAEQDRILVRINTSAGEEMRLWLTRRLMLGLWPVLSKLLTRHLLKLETAGSSLETADEDLRQMLAEFRKEQFLKEADFGTPFQEKKSILPLGEEPLLVTDVDATPLASGRLRLIFNERPPAASPRSFQMELDPKLMQGLMHLLDQALARSHWHEPFGGDGEEPPAGDSDLFGARRPRWLN
jgi:hypothetical protein